MIFDNIIHSRFYSEIHSLDKILSFCATVTPYNMPTETVRFDGTRVFLNPVHFTTKEESQCLYEAHKKYADVHFIVEGEEKIIINDLARLQVHTPYNTDKDIAFYSGNDGVVCILHPGDFLVCFPHDAHKVAIAPQSPAAVKKIVGKILYE